MCPRKWDTQASKRFLDTNKLPNLGQTNRPTDCQQKTERKKRERAEK